jgi:high-affinity iron transporter
MFQSLAITLREGVEAALILGIVLGYLRKTGRDKLCRVVFAGLFAAVAASLVVAYFLHRLQMNELSDTYEGALKLTASVFVASMVIWMWKTGKRLKQEIETKLSDLGSNRNGFATWGLFLFVFLMVFREGVETVLFLAAVSLRTTELLNFIGGVIGLALAVALGVAFFKGSIKVNLRKFFSVTTLVLLVVAAQLLVSGVHELSEAMVLPSGPTEMRIVGRLVNSDALFFVVVVGLCLFLVIAQRIQNKALTTRQLEVLQAAERRKVLAEQKRDRFWKLAASGCGMMIIIIVSGQFIYSQAIQQEEPAQPVSITNDQISIPITQLADHKLHHFSVPLGGTDVRLIAILDSSDTVHAALDACLICGHQGYYQDGGNVICRNCGAAVYVPSIGMAGGCNPIRLDPPYHAEGGTLLIPASALAEGARVFNR